VRAPIGLGRSFEALDTPATHAEFSEDLKTKVCWLYYMEGMTQDEIAKLLSLSRSRVLRFLANSRQSGLVQIRVTSKLSYCVELERQLESKYKLERAIVVPKPQNAAATHEIIGAVLGGYISEEITENMTVGLGWGTTLSASLPHIEFREQAGISVISMLGGLTRVSGSNPSEFAWRLADRVSADCYLMAAPVYAPDAHTREALLNHPGIMEIFSRARKLDLAVLSVGELSPFSTISKYFLLERDDFTTLQSAGAVGDVLCRFIDADGNVLKHPVNDRVIAVNPEELSNARKLVLASGGWQKYEVIRGALRLLKPHVLITDELVAERLVADAA
jgi:DNA-binding transcriptional regulator LsrR (DeoR family)